MTPKQEAAMRRVLKTMEDTHPGNMNAVAQETWDRAIKVLREALAEAQQQAAEPVADIGSTAGLRQMIDLMNQTDSSRWEIGFRNIVAALYGPHHIFEIGDVVERVRELAQQQPAEPVHWIVPGLNSEADRYRLQKGEA